MTRLVNVDPTEQPLEIIDTGQSVAFGEEVDVEDPALVESLVASGLWARPTSKAAKTAKEGS